MKTRLVAAALVAVTAFTAAGCASGRSGNAGTDEERASAYKIATNRGFTPTAYTSGSTLTDTTVDVTFGHCFGQLVITDKVITLHFRHAIAGAAANSNSDTEESLFDDPKVAALKDNPAYKPCFS